MLLINTITELQDALAAGRLAGLRIGLVPTMGALHEGHATLIRRAATENDIVVTTIFVNPLQFAPTEDLALYPRPIQDDHEIAAGAGATLLFCPTVEEMYPFGSAGVLTNVSVCGVADVLEGTHRPGHFDGVATVVAKLFAMTGACRAYFGEKDYQQLAVIRRMAADLSFPVDIVGVPTVREPNGLAMSSRNRYLTDVEREGASVIYRSISAARRKIDAWAVDNRAVDNRAVDKGAVDNGAVEREVVNYARIAHLVESSIAASPVVSSVDYVAIVDAETLVEPTPGNAVRILVACRVGRTRLIDNC
jgi:pantoate--beta-alanine ligase